MSESEPLEQDIAISTSLAAALLVTTIAIVIICSFKHRNSGEKRHSKYSLSDEISEESDPYEELRIETLGNVTVLDDAGQRYSYDDNPVNNNIVDILNNDGDYEYDYFSGQLGDVHEYDEGLSPSLLKRKSACYEDQYVEPQLGEEQDNEYLVSGQQVFEVDRERIHVDATLFAGDFFELQEGEGWFIGGKEGSTKVIIKQSIGNAISKSAIEAEIDLMKMLHFHENIDNIIACCTKSEPLLLITGRPKLGNLKKYLVDNRESVNKNQLLSFAIDVAKGMKYICSKKVVRRYLAMEHISVFEGMRCKISNFSYCTGVIDDGQFFTVTNQLDDCYRWIALESFQYGMYNMKTDIWTFGIVLWEIFTRGLTPYQGFKQTDVVTKLKQGFRLLRPDSCDEDVYNIMLPCWRRRPIDRPTFTSLLSALKNMREKEELESQDYSYGKQYTKLDDFYESEYVTPGQKVFEVNRNLIQITDTIYSGDFTEILHGMAYFPDNQERSREIAIKIVEESNDRTVRARVRREIDVLKSLSPHRNVISLFAYSTNRDRPYLILEYAQHGDLRKYLVENRNILASGNYFKFQRRLLSFAFDVANGMAYLSSMKIVHRYLSTRHVLVCNDLTCKVSNLSYSNKVISDESFLRLESKDQLPYQWMALETLENMTFSVHTDVWSFGVLFWEILTLGCHPFEEQSREEIETELRRGYRLLQPEHCHLEVYGLMLMCWRKEDWARPSFPNIVKQIRELRDDNDKSSSS
ncbi:tyrosine-protein kinase JAK2-like isoform X2 [Ptychodera flava]|uniref:tyrosine-protein kinase JAK2-like isoform X2 n=1 Tax=Ptychodera flava TaxID=63121 RepID=UPI00396A66DF